MRLGLIYFFATMLVVTLVITMTTYPILMGIKHLVNAEKSKCECVRECK